MTPKYCASAQKHRFCPAGTCRTCDRRRGMLIPVSRETATANIHFYAVYYTDKFGVLRWTTPLGFGGRRRQVPDSDTLLMARAALAVGLPEYKRPVAQELPGVE